MIHFIVATSSEARPIIDIFNLNKTKIDSSNIYNNDEISLTISGIGKINSAVGVTQTFYEFKSKKVIIY